MKILIEYISMLPVMVCVAFCALYISKRGQKTRLQRRALWFNIFFTFVYLGIEIHLRMLHHIHWWFLFVALGLTAITLITSLIFYRKNYPEDERENCTKAAVNEVETMRDGVSQQDVIFATIYERLKSWTLEKKPYLNPHLKMEMACRATGTNKTYLTHVLKRYENCTFSDYIAKQRIEFAKEYLENNPNEKLVVVGIVSGFASVEVFCRTFKAQTGQTPGEYKESCKQEELTQTDNPLTN